MFYSFKCFPSWTSHFGGYKIIWFDLIWINSTNFVWLLRTTWTRITQPYIFMLRFDIVVVVVYYCLAFLIIILLYYEITKSTLGRQRQSSHLWPTNVWNTNHGRRRPTSAQTGSSGPVIIIFIILIVEYQWCVCVKYIVLWS